MPPHQFTPEERRRAVEARAAKKAAGTVEPKPNGTPAEPAAIQRVEPQPLSLGADWPLPSRDEWLSLEPEAHHTLIQRLCASYQEGAKLYNQRVYDDARASMKYRCLVCGKSKPIALDNHPNYVWENHIKDPLTGVLTSQRICSQECYMRGANSGALTNAKVPANVHK